MRHQCRVPQLGRPADQRKAMLRGLTTQLIREGRVTTTKARAKALKWTAACFVLGMLTIAIPIVHFVTVPMTFIACPVIYFGVIKTYISKMAHILCLGKRQMR